MENFMYLKKKKKQEHIFHPTKDGVILFSEHKQCCEMRIYHQILKE